LLSSWMWITFHPYIKWIWIIFHSHKMGQLPDRTSIL
jgi:hypothetical protein